MTKRALYKLFNKGVDRKTYIYARVSTAKQKPDSIGVFVFPEDADSAEELLRCADIAMYKAKQD